MSNQQHNVAQPPLVYGSEDDDVIGLMNGRRVVGDRVEVRTYPISFPRLVSTPSESPNPFYEMFKNSRSVSFCKKFKTVQPVTLSDVAKVNGLTGPQFPPVPRTTELALLDTIDVLKYDARGSHPRHRDAIMRICIDLAKTSSQSYTFAGVLLRPESEVHDEEVAHLLATGDNFVDCDLILPTRAEPLAPVAVPGRDPRVRFSLRDALDLHDRTKRKVEWSRASKRKKQADRKLRATWSIDTDAVDDWVRSRMREDGFFRRIIPVIDEPLSVFSSLTPPVSHDPVSYRGDADVQAAFARQYQSDFFADEIRERVTTRSDDDDDATLQFAVTPFDQQSRDDELDQFDRDCGPIFHQRIGLTAGHTAGLSRVNFD